ncbi:hypothetical protein BJ508DRAFT_333596 [Ascobolus immersus RN42]|uniref:F-box domain-containing protein n=1 Tax=Ascobolus immersus RN42 TaxID=1160509 RepID=A0A3N4HJ43_ASCIM|nr:hypothetical protein BJ508DRAFT_333596 [Ascobolus immersus RN42]
MSGRRKPYRTTTPEEDVDKANKQNVENPFLSLRTEIHHIIAMNLPRRAVHFLVHTSRCRAIIQHELLYKRLLHTLSKSLNNWMRRAPISKNAQSLERVDVIAFPSFIGTILRNSRRPFVCLPSELYQNVAKYLDCSSLLVRALLLTCRITRVLFHRPLYRRRLSMVRQSYQSSAIVSYIEDGSDEDKITSLLAFCRKEAPTQSEIYAYALMFHLANEFVREMVFGLMESNGNMELILPKHQHTGYAATRMMRQVDSIKSFCRILLEPFSTCFIFSLCNGRDMLEATPCRGCVRLLEACKLIMSGGFKGLDAEMDVGDKAVFGDGRGGLLHIDGMCVCTVLNRVTAGVLYLFSCFLFRVGVVGVIPHIVRFALAIPSTGETAANGKTLERPAKHYQNLAPKVARSLKSSLTGALKPPKVSGEHELILWQHFHRSMG